MEDEILEYRGQLREVSTTGSERQSSNCSDTKKTEITQKMKNKKKKNKGEEENNEQRVT